MNHWSDTQNPYTNWPIAWDVRTALVAEMIPPHSSVLEFGAGKEHLATLLPEGCEYQPSDVIARTERTFVCDLNKPFPTLDKKWDVIVLSGVLEYIVDVPALLSKLRTNCMACILTYAPVDGLECMTTRMKNSWVNHFNAEQFETLLANAGFTIQQQKTWNNQEIYNLR